MLQNIPLQLSHPDSIQSSYIGIFDIQLCLGSHIPVHFVHCIDVHSKHLMLYSKQGASDNGNNSLQLVFSS